jgi:stage III sporulation protein AE
MAGKVFGELKTEKFCSFFKSINKWIIGIGVSVFGLFFTVQGITAATYDGIVRRAAKYAIGTGVPIIGGFLSGGFDLAIAGSVLIKNALGNFSLVLLVMILLRPLSVLIASNVLLRLSAAITHPFGDSKIASFLEETAENLQFCTAGVLFSAFLYFIAILIMVFASGMFV